METIHIWILGSIIFGLFVYFVPYRNIKIIQKKLDIIIDLLNKNVTQLIELLNKEKNKWLKKKELVVVEDHQLVIALVGIN